MGTPYMGEIRLMSFNFPPKNWAFCNGQFLPINQNQALFALLGTTYGGNGQTTFALPDLRGKVPIHFGNGYSQGQQGGEPSHTLTISEMPAHTHLLSASRQMGNAAFPGTANAAHLLAAEPSNAYAPALSPNTVALHALSVTQVGGSQAHENRQPFAVLNFCIALAGVFPSQN